MKSELRHPDLTELKPRITVFGVGGGGGNAVNNMISLGLPGVDFVVANTDAQALSMSKCDRVIQLGTAVTQGLGAGAMPEMGKAAAEECKEEIESLLANYHMVFITAGMGGGTGTGAAPVVARIAKEKGILTVGVVTKPFDFEGIRRMKTAEEGIKELQSCVDTLIVIPNQNLFRIATEKTTFAEAFKMADQVLYSGVASITDLMVKEGLINLDFADVRSVMTGMGRAMMGTGEATGEGRALKAAEAAIANPLLDQTSMRGASGLLISITGGRDMTLFEVDEAANRIRQEVDAEADVIFGAIDDESLEGTLRVSVVATGIDSDNNREYIVNGNGTSTLSTSKAKPVPSSTSFKAESAMKAAMQSVEAQVAAIPAAPLQASLRRVEDKHLNANSQANYEKLKATASEAIRSAASEPQIVNPRKIMEFSFEQFEDKNQQNLQSEQKAQILPKEAAVAPKLAERSKFIPAIDDFAPHMKKSVEFAKSGKKPVSEPRTFWKKLKNVFVAETDGEERGRLEPREEIETLKQEMPWHNTAEFGQASFNQVNTYLDEMDEIEIPAFLRKKA